MMAAVLTNAVQDLAAGFGGAKELPRPLPHDAFVPWREHDDPEADELDASLNTLDSLRGF